MLQFRDRSGDKNPEMADVGIEEIDDPLASPLQVVRVLVDDRNPSHRLMRRRNVVAGRGKDDNRIVDSAQIGKAPVADAKGALFQPIADKQVPDDGKDLFTAEEVETAPPAFEPEKALALAIDMREQVRVFLPHRFRPQSLEILHQPGAVKPSISEIGHEVRRPGAAEQAAGDAHRVGAGIAGPIGQRRSVQDNWAGETFTIGGKQSDRPSSLAVSVKDRRRPGMAACHFLDEPAQRVEHVGDCLAWARLGKEDDEIDRIALMQGNADFRLALEAADTRTMTGTRIDDDQTGGLEGSRQSSMQSSPTRVMRSSA